MSRWLQRPSSIYLPLRQRLFYSSGISGGGVGGGAGGGQPPTPSGNIRLDTRVGGAKNIQAAGVTNITQAEAASGFGTNENTATPYLLDFTTDVGDGSKAFRFNWKEGGPTGYGSGCQQPLNQFHEHDMGIEQYSGAVGTDEVWVQWKRWFGKTASGGGVGSVANWVSWPPSCGIGMGKSAIMFRAGESQDGRLTLTNGQTADKRMEVINDRQGANADLSATYRVPVVEWDNLINQWVTTTFRIKPGSGDRTLDGIFELWVNANKVFSKLDIPWGPLGFTTWLQLGGPTWQGPPQDQTMYMKDIVVWQP